MHHERRDRPIALRSSADNLFRKGGDYWTPLQDLVFELHKILPGLIPQSELAATINAARGSSGSCSGSYAKTS